MLKYEQCTKFNSMAIPFIWNCKFIGLDNNNNKKTFFTFTKCELERTAHNRALKWCNKNEYELIYFEAKVSNKIDEKSTIEL